MWLPCCSVRTREQTPYKSCQSSKYPNSPYSPALNQGQTESYALPIPQGSKPQNVFIRPLTNPYGKSNLSISTISKHTCSSSSSSMLHSVLPIDTTVFRFQYSSRRLLRFHHAKSSLLWIRVPQSGPLSRVRYPQTRGSENSTVVSLEIGSLTRVRYPQTSGFKSPTVISLELGSAFSSRCDWKTSLIVLRSASRVRYT